MDVPPGYYSTKSIPNFFTGEKSIAAANGIKAYSAHTPIVIRPTPRAAARRGGGARGPVALGAPPQTPFWRGSEGRAPRNTLAAKPPRPQPTRPPCPPPLFTLLPAYEGHAKSFAGFLRNFSLE